MNPRAIGMMAPVRLTPSRVTPKQVQQSPQCISSSPTGPSLGLPNSHRFKLLRCRLFIVHTPGLCTCSVQIVIQTDPDSFQWVTHVDFLHAQRLACPCLLISSSWSAAHGLGGRARSLQIRLRSGAAHTITGITRPLDAHRFEARGSARRKSLLQR